MTRSTRSLLAHVLTLLLLLALPTALLAEAEATEAETTEADSAEEETETGAMRYPLDSNHSTIGFEAPILGVSKVTGKFSAFRGAILVHDPSDLTSSEMEVTFETASIDTGIDDRDEHLRGPDFFDVENHPQASFKSAHIEALDDGEGRYLMTGDFTMGGVTNQIRFPFQVTDHSNTVAAEARMVIDRTDYGVAWSRVMDDGSLFVGHDVTIEIFLLTRVGKPWSPEDEIPAPGTTNEPDRGKR